MPIIFLISYNDINAIDGCLTKIDNSKIIIRLHGLKYTASLFLDQSPTTDDR